MYVPDTELILFHSGMLQPEESEAIYFQAPRKPGEYWIVCPFPGHSKTIRVKWIVK